MSIKLNVFELNRIKKICEEVGTDYFELDQTDNSGIGRILTLTYNTEIADLSAKVTIEVSGVEEW
jgi:hypothetical protein